MGTALLANNQQAPAISDRIFLHHFYNIYLLLAEFSVPTVNYGPSFFLRFIDGKKNEDRNLQYGPKKRG